jgi:hypothetical protein
MRKYMALVVALAATISLGLASIAPTWLEDLGPDTTYTYGEYSTVRAVVENSFTPQSLNSQLYFASDGVSGLVDQTVSTSIQGQSIGIDRQLLEQSASAYVAEAPGLAIDAENDASATVLVMEIKKDQDALYSGKLIAGECEEVTGTDVDGDGVTDDPYGGGHLLTWLEGGAGPSWTATFDDTATLVANAESEEEVTLAQEVNDATVTVSVDGDECEPTNFQITDPGCVGDGEFWLVGDGITTGPLACDGDGLSDAQLTEVAASMSSCVSLKDTETMILGNIINTRTLDGSASLGGAFENALVDANEPVNIDMDGDIDFWWQ